MILEKDQLPAAPSGHRMLVKPFPPDEKEGELHIPDIAKVRPNMGIILGAGLTARDQLYDSGHEIGDEVWWGKYAGVIEQWDHIIEEGARHKSCKEHDWSRRPETRDRMHRWQGEICGSHRLAEPVLVMNVDDILCNVSLQRRIESGVISIIRGKLADGKTQHVLNRKDK